MPATIFLRVEIAGGSCEKRSADDEHHHEGGRHRKEPGARSLVGAGRHRPERPRHRAGHHGAGDRPADAVGEAGRHHEPAAVDLGRLHARPGRPAAARRRPGRPLRPPPPAGDRAADLRRRLRRGQPDDLGERPDPDAGGHGRRRRHHPPAVAVHPAHHVLAGWLLTHYDWGSVFLINAPVIALAVPGVWFLVPESRDPEAPRLDWIGAILSVAGVSGLVYGIIEEPANGWTDSRVLASLIGGAVILAAFVVLETRRRSPLVDLRLFRNRRFTWSTIAFTVVGFAMTGLMFVIAPYLQVVMRNDAQGTGIRLIPMIGGLMLGAGPSDRLTARLGTKVMVAGGLLVTSAGVILLSQAGADTGYGLVAAALAVV